MGDAEIIPLAGRGPAPTQRPGRRSHSAAAPHPEHSVPHADPELSEPQSEPELEPEPGPQLEPQSSPGRPEPQSSPGRPEPQPGPGRVGAAGPQTSDHQPSADGGPGSHRHPGGARSHRRPEPSALLGGVGDLVSGLLGLLRQAPVGQVRDFAADPLRALAGLAEAAGVDWQADLDELAAFARSRFSGDYAVDAFGFDPEFTERVFLPLLRPLVRSWFRVEIRGAENLPTAGPALLVSNHAGTIPVDAMVLHAMVHDEIGRHVRMLGADLIFSTPFSHDLARRIGSTLACQEDAERLLAAGELVSVFPEGFKGLGKPYSDRYKLQRFGRGGFVSAAVRAQVPIVPVSIVGSEEIYPLLATAPALSRALGWPYFPVTPLFPWFGVLGMIPLPSKWIIQIGEQIATDELPAGAADDPMITFNVTDQVRETIQHSLYALLVQRPHAFG